MALAAAPGAGNAFCIPAHGGLVPQLGPATHVQGANAPISIAQGSRNMAGPVIDGLPVAAVSLDPDELKRIAMMAQDGLPRAIRPVHSPFDGDVVFALSTGRVTRLSQAALWRSHGSVRLPPISCPVPLHAACSRRRSHPA